MKTSCSCRTAEAAGVCFLVAGVVGRDPSILAPDAAVRNPWSEEGRFRARKDRIESRAARYASYAFRVTPRGARATTETEIASVIPLQ
jgi:hypothetical protein